MVDPSPSQATSSSTPRAHRRGWFLVLAGLGLLLAGGVVGTVVFLSATLYRQPAGSAPFSPLAVALPTTAAPAAPRRTAPVVDPTPPPPPIGPGVGQWAPGFRLDGLDGQIYDLADFRGQAILITFWASWSPPCQGTWPELCALAQEVDGREMAVLAINVAESSAVVHDFCGEEPLPLLVLLDDDGQVGDRYRVNALPTTFLLDQEGIVRQVVPGEIALSELRALVRATPPDR